MARPVKALRIQVDNVNGVTVCVVSGHDDAGHKVSLTIPAEGLQAALAGAPLGRNVRFSPMGRGSFGKWLTQAERFALIFAGALALATVLALWCFPAWLLP